MGFGRTWRSWVRECVRTASISILVNGSPSKPFKMERGLRQGDPLSPFLFVLVVEVLNRMIRDAVRNGIISSLLVGRDNIELSHLQFTDDTILFCPPDEETIRNYKRLLRCFEIMSGLSINFEKPNLILVNCRQEWVTQMCQQLGCQEAALPVRYLGISLGANPRLAPKKLGGLGVGDTVVRNAALLFKWWWRFSKEECPLWKKIVCSCNNLNPNLLLSTQKLPERGGPRRDISKLPITEQHVRQKMIDGLAIEVGDGRSTRFWEDTWLQVGKLKNLFPRLFMISNQQESVIGDCGFWDGLEWVWQFQWRRELRPWETDTLDQMLQVLQSVSLIAEVQDRMVWNFHKEGIYSTNSFVQVMQEETLDEELQRY
nr:uncharacterized protein LOC112717769 [Arachis hypogaea]